MVVSPNIPKRNEGRHPDTIRAMILAYDEFVDFIAAGTTPQTVVDFRPSEATKARIAELINHQKTSPLSPEEAAELNHYRQIEHLMRLAKSRARQLIFRR